MLTTEVLFIAVVILTITSAAAAVALSSEETMQRVVVVRLVRTAFLGACAIIMLLLDGAGL